MRYNIINDLIKINGYTDYLEIGVQTGVCFHAVVCKNKTGVDPDPESKASLIMSSDDFFEQNKKTFDIIFIDGLHYKDQVIRDINNALKILRDSGTIIVHDCNPISYESQLVPRETKQWNGDVWKAWVHFRTHANLKMYVLDEDQGCGVIQKGYQEPIIPTDDYFEFVKNKKYYLNIC